MERTNTAAENALVLPELKTALAKNPTLHRHDLVSQSEGVLEYTSRKWLSVKQAAWLSKSADQYGKGNHLSGYHADGALVSWELQISPINQAGCLRVTCTVFDPKFLA